MKYLLIPLSGFQIADGAITQFFVSNGLVHEGNPFARPIVMGGNFLLLKVIGALISAAVLYLLYKRFPRIARTAASTIVVFYSAVLLWDLIVVLNGSLPVL